jgi:GNAT superfamily N-acetyltransferase
MIECGQSEGRAQRRTRMAGVQMVEAALDELPDSVWHQQAAQAPQTGTPNSIKQTRIEEAEALLFYDDAGCLRGMLKYFEKDVPRSNQFGDYLVAHAGELVIIVDPRYQRRGVGTKLLREAIAQWQIDLERQRYTPSGAAFVNEFQPKEVG